MQPEEPLRAALRQLRVDYLERAPERLAELWAACERVQNDGVAALDDLRLLVHRLAGSGGAYGLPAVTARALEADQLCRQLADAGGPITADDLQRLRRPIQGIADAFHDTTPSE